jgi:xylulokinase
VNVPTRVLGIDVGTTNVKVALVDPHGARVLASTTRPTPPAPDALVRAVVEAVARCAREAPGARVAAVGVASMAETGAPFDRDDRPLTPFVDWADPRAGDVATRLGDVVDPFELFARTGVRLGPKAPLAKWAWFAEHETATWRRTARWAGAADVVVHALTGRWATDHTLAGRTGALALGESGFDDALTRLAGLDPDRLPDLLAPGDAAGGVRPGPFADAGLAPGIPVHVAGHDHAVGSWAVGVRRPGQVADSLGTSEAVYAIVEDGVMDRAAERHRLARHGMSLVRTVSGERHAVVAGSPAAGRLVAWWCQALAPSRTPRTLFDGLDPDVGAASPGATGPVVLPYLLGRQAPFPDPRARVDVLGAGPRDDETTLRAALRDGLALHARWMIQEATAGAAPTSVVVLGGPARNEPWVRRKAALSPWRTARATDPDAVVLGAALLAAERSGIPTAPVATQAVAVPGAPEASDALDQFVAAALRRGAPPPTAPSGRTTRGTA